MHLSSSAVPDARITSSLPHLHLFVLLFLFSSSVVSAATSGSGWVGAGAGETKGVEARSRKQLYDFPISREKRGKVFINEKYMELSADFIGKYIFFV